jgi:3-oxoacyl-[acyl-carrier protein] reductase
MLSSRVVLITGASRGIGAATARLLAKHGAAVAVNYQSNSAAAAQVVKNIADAGGRALSVGGDVRNADEVEAMVKTASDWFGPIDTLVLNAHMGFSPAPFLEASWEDFEASVIGELKAVFNCVKAVAPSMIERKTGCIIATSSIMSKCPAPGFSAHSAAKAGLDAVMRTLALELGPKGIRVNTVAPGFTLTDLTVSAPEGLKRAITAATPLGRVAAPEDVAGAISMLIREEARFITGHQITVDGGAGTGQYPPLHK